MTCGGMDAVKWAAVTSQNYYTVNVMDIAINGISTGTVQSFGSSWQTGTGGSSMFDSCTTLFYLPQSAFDKLALAIQQSPIWSKAGVSQFLVDKLIAGYGLYDVSSMNVLMWYIYFISSFF